jgi:hypothetical protein
MNNEISVDKDLRYNLSTSDKHVKGNPIIITFTLENLSNQDLWVLTWYTPLEGIKGEIFKIVCNGEEIPYEGRLVKRGLPTKDNYMSIGSRKSISAEVDLSTAYTFPTCNECIVSFNGMIYDVQKTYEFLPKKEHKPFKIMGNSVSFSIVNG